MNEASHRVQHLLDSLVASGEEHGLQVAVYHKGSLIVDAFAGVADVRTGRKVDKDTLFPVFSTTKGIAATVLHRLYERDLIDYDRSIAHYWPEFGAHGKGAITLRHALSHSSGVPYMPMGLGYPDICDWTTICSAIAGLSPAFPPGDRWVYEALTYGWLLGEVARRVTYRPFSELLHDEIAAPLGLSDLFMGIPDALEDRVAYLEMPDPFVADADYDNEPRDIPGWMSPLHEAMNRSDLRKACSPGVNGIMTAHAVARHYAALLPGGVDGVQLLQPSTVAMATKIQIPARGMTEEDAMRWGLGYVTGEKIAELGLDAASFGHQGHGGSVGFANTRHHLAVGIVRNRFSPNALTPLVLKEIEPLLV